MGNNGKFGLTFRITLEFLCKTTYGQMGECRA